MNGINKFVLYCYNLLLMARQITSDCTSHNIKLCEENKMIIIKEQARFLTLGKRRNIEQIINNIINEWNKIKK